MKILLTLANDREAQLFEAGLECLGHRVLVCRDLNSAAKWLRDWCPDVAIADESLGRGDPDSGLRLAELCRIAAEQEQGSFRTQSLVLVPLADWDRIRRARRTGAHVIVKSPSPDVVLRYIQTIADNLTTDRVLGPLLFGIHRFRGEVPQKLCTQCKWVGASLAYGTSQTDIQFTMVRAALFNCLLFCRRGLSAAEIAARVNEHGFLKSLLHGCPLRESAIKMEISRMRRGIGEALETIGAPYQGTHFLPHVPHGIQRYRLAGNWQLSHIPCGGS